MILFLSSFDSYNSTCCKVEFSAIRKIIILMGCVEIIFLCIYFHFLMMVFEMLKHVANNKI